MSALTNEELRDRIRALVPQVDLKTTGIKAFTKLLAASFAETTPGIADILKERAAFIKEQLSEAINELVGEEEEESEEEEEEEEQAVVEKKPVKGLAVKKEISPALASFLGQGPEMSRTEIVKALWDYIKEHNLQNPENKREILLDDSMMQVFGVEKFTMFTMNKYIGAHVHPFKPVDLTAKPKTPRKKRKGAGGDDDKSKKKRKPKKPGLQPPYQLSPALAAVVGHDILPRPQVVAKIWEYIKRNELQSIEDKRQILCDEPLKQVMGGNETVTMFNMNRYITPHLLEKLDKSAYNHDQVAEKAAPEEADEDDEEEEEDEI